jgi:hypothetical protein
MRKNNYGNIAAKVLLNHGKYDVVDDFEVPKIKKKSKHSDGEKTPQNFGNFGEVLF